MRHAFPFRSGLLLLVLSISAVRAQEPVSLFNGSSLDGWDGDPRFWKVEDGCITGQTTEETPTEANTFLIWKLGGVDDFELTAEYRIESGNSGIQVRSFRLPDRQWGLGGYQADLEAGDRYSGIIYGENFRDILADRGQKTTVGDNHQPVVNGSTGEEEAIRKAVKQGEWNEYRVVAKGYTLQNFINGQLMAELTDEDTAMRRRDGLLALQLHAGPPMKVQFRNLKLKRLPLTDRKKVVFVAGRPSHGPGQHEHRAGSMLLANALNESSAGQILATVYREGWPQDPSAFSNADAIVMYSDGGAGHMVMPRLADVEAAYQRGVGIGSIHYAVEIPAGPGGEHFLKWMGGYFEENWSVNPHWTADFQSFPTHAAAAGLKPFSINDEWYFHMRFRDGMKGVTPLLTAVPPAETMNRPNGPHAGNDTVREAVAKGTPQTLCWLSENENGSRGFGFTGGHFHRNWQNDDFRRTVLNSIAWIAKADIPEGGVPSHRLSDDDLSSNLDPKKN